jgi:hypothetical protein
MTASAAAIVTALGDGPATASDLSQRLDGISYANIRQQLRRLAASGIVTNLRRGLYAVDCDSGHCDNAPEPAVVTDEDWNAALAAIWQDFEAQDDPHDERAWV